MRKTNRQITSNLGHQTYIFSFSKFFSNGYYGTTLKTNTRPSAINKKISNDQHLKQFLKKLSDLKSGLTSKPKS